MTKCLAMNVFGILVHSGCHKKIPQTRLLINNRDQFLILLEDKKSKIK